MVQADDLVEYGFRRVIITITAVMCALLESVDTTIVNVALTNMRGSLGATLTDVAWVITAYAIANVIVIPMTSWLSQQFGRRNYFAVSIIIFTVSSFLCGNATNIWELVAFRFVQGLTQAQSKERYDALGAEPVGLDSADFKTLLASEARQLSTLIRDKNISAE